MKIDDVYKQMIEAANRATQNSNLYKARDSELTERNYSDINKANDYWLDKYYKRYQFWRDEQNRLANLLQAHYTYIMIKINKPQIYTVETEQIQHPVFGGEK